MNDIVDKLEKRLAVAFDVSTDDIKRITNKKNASIARGYAWYILHYEYKFSAAEIAKKYGRTKRAVFNLISKTRYEIENQKKIMEKYLRIKDTIC